MSNYDCKGCKHRTNHTDEGFKFCSGCDRSYLGADSGYHADRYEKEEAEMSMTDNEALQWFKGFYNCDCEREDFENTICADCNFPCRHGLPILRAISALEEIQQYRAIGTVSEFRELKEKATAKKPIETERNNLTVWDCSQCGNELYSGQKFCDECGNAIADEFE